MRFTSLIILLFLATPLALHADTVELRWKEVRGSSGYLVRIRKSDGQTIENRIGTNELRLDLDPGEYTIRIAGLNKFGKPGPFSDPAKVTIQASERTQKIDVDAPATRNEPAKKPEPENIPAKEEPKEESPPIIYDSYSFTESLVPGLPQYSKQSYKIYAFNGLLLAHAFAGFREKQRGDAISRDPLNDPTGLLAVTSGQPVAFAYLWNRRAEQKRR
ncbi:MAG: fibronectin type III domain-containing protein, partial [Leptospiraceae bacterium]|nr:fibronectin type III domain-containing protein [Leptospiraceae bacterium]